ncbi:twin-arginine translocase TatA/TatE family subunit [Actinokineospora inagensis]|uniref:twin-arginine translocase TatA/TatE family subunit n=1 Tax=Actinokineospora inagensis TaxID=103730 RepID=UPI000416FC45|nr:twin-arginine translocase TatA/TatE family subunit [Actinokineospora inagensis]
MFANGLEWPHLLIVALVFMLFFGAKRLPEAAQSLGRSLRVFKQEFSTKPVEPGSSEPES